LVLSRGLLYLPSFPDCFLQRECSAARQCTAPLPMPNITTCCPSSGSAGLLWRSMLFWAFYSIRILSFLGEILEPSVIPHC
jgi:hypothetical protein